MNTRVRTKAKDPIESAVIALSRAEPELGQARVAAALADRGLSVSPSGVRLIWQRHDLETVYKRISALASRSAAARSRLTERQLRLLDRGEVVARGARRRTTRSANGTPDRRLQILRAAADRFSKDGYAGASLRDIGRQIGLLPGSIYHHFPTKDDLFLSVHHQGFDQLIANVTQAVARSDDAWRRLESACGEHIRALVAGDTILRLTGASFFTSFEPALRRRLRPDRDRYDALFKRLVADLDLPASVDRTMFRLALLGAINWTHVWYREGRRTPEDIAHRIVALMRVPRDG